MGEVGEETDIVGWGRSGQLVVFLKKKFLWEVKKDDSQACTMRSRN